MGKKLNRVYNLEKVLTQIRKRRSRLIGDGLAITKVGYSAPYALAVHERMDVPHRVGQAKFLEQPIRTEEKPMNDIIVSRLRAHMTLKAAQLEAAKHLIKVSIQLVPVDTGVLVASWFIT